MCGGGVERRTKCRNERLLTAQPLTSTTSSRKASYQIKTLPKKPLPEHLPTSTTLPKAQPPNLHYCFSRLPCIFSTTVFASGLPPSSLPPCHHPSSLPLLPSYFRCTDMLDEVWWHWCNIRSVHGPSIIASVYMSYMCLHCVHPESNGHRGIHGFPPSESC